MSLVLLYKIIKQNTVLICRFQAYHEIKNNLSTLKTLHFEWVIPLVHCKQRN